MLTKFGAARSTWRDGPAPTRTTPATLRYPVLYEQGHSRLESLRFEEAASWAESGSKKRFSAHARRNLSASDSYFDDSYAVNSVNVVRTATRSCRS